MRKRIPHRFVFLSFSIIPLQFFNVPFFYSSQVRLTALQFDSKKIFAVFFFFQETIVTFSIRFLWVIFFSFFVLLVLLFSELMIFHFSFEGLSLARVFLTLAFFQFFFILFYFYLPQFLWHCFFIHFPSFPPPLLLFWAFNFEF